MKDNFKKMYVYASDFSTDETPSFYNPASHSILIRENPLTEDELKMWYGSKEALEESKIKIEMMKDEKPKILSSQGQQRWYDYQQSIALQDTLEKEAKVITHGSSFSGIEQYANFNTDGTLDNTYNHVDELSRLQKMYDIVNHKLEQLIAAGVKKASQPETNWFSPFHQEILHDKKRTNPRRLLILL